MSQKFCDEITAAMKRIGRTVECRHWGSSGGRITLKVVGQDDITVEYENARNEGQVQLPDLDNSMFKVDVRTGRYRVDRLVGLLLTHEAKILKGRADEKAREVLRAERQKRQDWVRGINTRLDDDRINVSVPWEPEKTYYTVTFRVDDQATVLALIDHVQDNGYVIVKKEEKKPE